MDIKVRTNISNEYQDIEVCINAPIINEEVQMLENELLSITSKSIKQIANDMEAADILVSHDKPFTEKQYGDAHDGLKGITQYIYKNNIPLHIHGHLHEESEEILTRGSKFEGYDEILQLYFG